MLLQPWRSPEMSTEKPVRILCPNLACRKVLAVPQSARGKTVRCRSCSTAIRVPMPAAIAPTPTPEPEPAPEAPAAEVKKSA